MALDPVHRSRDANRTADDGPPGPHLPGSPREHRHAVVDALRDGGGRLSVEALARDVAERFPRRRPRQVTKRYSAYCSPTSSPRSSRRGGSRSRRSDGTVSLSGSGTSGRRTLVSGGAVSVALVALVASASDPSSPAFLGAVGLSLLSVLYLARRRTRRWRRRVSGPNPRSDVWNAVHSTGPAAATHAAPPTADPEQRILALLLADGGRARQQTLIDRLGLSKSTVSRHVSSLAEAGFVTKVPIGRENLVCLPGAHPADGSALGAPSSA